MDERHGGSARSRTGSFVEHAEALGLDRFEGHGAVSHAITDVMNARAAAVGEPFGHGAVVTGRGEQLHVALRHLEQGLLDAITLDDLAMVDGGAEGVAVVVDGCTQIGHRDGDVIDLGEKRGGGS